MMQLNEYSFFWHVFNLCKIDTLSFYIFNLSPSAVFMDEFLYRSWSCWDAVFFLNKTKTLWLLFVDGFSFLEASESLPGDSLLFITESPGIPGIYILIWRTLEVWKAEATLKPPSGFELKIPEFEIQHTNYWAIAP